ncbi:hypothetical protein C0992_013107 [Termitomyces sp. T32_za158]|nr:hypothetical protein C0992_013107 [Termitomyces sp. T32_za158]
MALQQQLRDKTNRYLQAQWWEAQPASQAASLLFILKKDGMLRTALDACQRNDNTVKDVTPLPDQEVIRKDVACMNFRSKFDLTDAYEQEHIDRIEKHHKIHEYVNADIHIDPLGDDLLYHRYKEVKEHVVEIRAMQVHELWRSRQVQDRKEAQDMEAEQLAQAQPELAAPMMTPKSNVALGAW